MTNRDSGAEKCLACACAKPRRDQKSESISRHARASNAFVQGITGYCRLSHQRLARMVPTSWGVGEQELPHTSRPRYIRTTPSSPPRSRCVSVSLRRARAVGMRERTDHSKVALNGLQAEDQQH